MSWERGDVALLEQALRLTGVGRDREGALARELALGAVRHRRLYDALAAPYLRGGDQPLALLVALRLMAHQLFALDRIPAHAAVSRSVGCLGGGDRRLRGVANAVGRRLAELRLEQRDDARPGPLGRIPPAAVPADPALRYSLPDALVADLRPILPAGDETALAALGQVPPLCTRSRPGHRVPPGPEVLRQEGPWTWWDDPRAALEGPVARGEAVVQDRSQGASMELAGLRGGELVLDCCAAPGGKARWLHDHGCRVIAGELALAKLGRLAYGPDALGTVLRQDARHPAVADAAFDLVVVDAPCSNSGVLARRPEARWRYSAQSVEDLVALQRAILAAVAPLVAPGGRLLYATCSLSPQENAAWRAALPGWDARAERLHWPDTWSGGGYAVLLARGAGPSGP